MTQPPHDKDVPGSTLECVERWRGGDDRALDALVAKLSPLLRERVRRKPAFAAIASGTTPDDVVQEVWLHVVRAGAHSFTPEGRSSFFAWLCQITDRTLVDFCRERSAIKRGGGHAQAPMHSGVGVESRYLPGAAAPMSPSGEARLAEFDQVAESALGERERLAWRLVAMEGYTSEEASIALDCTRAAVRALMSRSREKLMRALDQRRGVD